MKSPKSIMKLRGLAALIPDLLQQIGRISIEMEALGERVQLGMTGLESPVAG
jgi:hypothetical protein